MSSLHETTQIKQHCEQHAIAFTNVSTSYAYLRCMLFGVEWDPADYFQVLVSFLWQQEHSSVALLTLACEDAQRILCGEEPTDS